ncbi:hypothetical protein SAMN06298224_2148 [Fibrobacter sp. UWB16]|uniref:Uncharacterized protein n=2 Tax=Fibrobacter succinogenes TaxID=833 RepID=A0A380S778_FIBSU|nr:hypothetical protein Fisuc_1626 [Fibrobacter succinogenes subsp. succinogenes S85]PWJ34631.1 hypothetical protein IE02_2168 [Fibrobacter succinogenes subsp. elongatus]SOD15640.1 hypothetical protein SAMN06298224_2148 [Fibrobacter sp. UWB16]SUQ24754.1 hypothetical protein SAMN05661053_2168 [Fibrobacter succinogenes]
MKRLDLTSFLGVNCELILGVKFAFYGSSYYLYGEKGLQGSTLGKPFRLSKK